MLCCSLSSPSNFRQYGVRPSRFGKNSSEIAREIKPNRTSIFRRVAISTNGKVSKGRVDNLSALGAKTGVLKNLFKSLEKRDVELKRLQLFAEKTNRIGIWDSSVGLDSQKLLKGKTIRDLVFHILVAQIV